MRSLSLLRFFAAACLLPVFSLPAYSADNGGKPTPEEIAAERAENAIALYAKLLCSGVFVVGRDADEFIENDLQGQQMGLPSWDKIERTIDRNKKSVTLSMKGIPARTAVYNGDQGCTLCPRGETQVHFEPIDVPTKLPDAATTPWPMGDKLSDEPLPEGVDKEAIDAALAWAIEDSHHDPPQKTRALVVVYKGRIIGEKYAPGFDMHTRHISWSMGKSITAALVGLLADDGHFKPEDPAPIDRWQGKDDPRSEIRITDLMHMSSGLQFHMGNPLSGTMLTKMDNHRYVYFGAPNVFEYSVKRELEFPPNTVWRYRNCDPLALGKIVKDTVEAEGEEYLTFPQRALFDKIGARNFVLECDPYGNFIMTGFDYGTARDWARFGLLHLQNGRFNGEQVLSKEWIDYVRQPAPANLAENYGGLFWLNAGGELSELPKDMYWPGGHMGQTVRIIPSMDLVIVRQGHSERGGFDPYIAEVLKRIIAGLEEPEPVTARIAK